MSILFFSFKYSIEQPVTQQLSSVNVLKLPFEQSNSPSKCIDTVHVEHDLTITITYHLSMHTPFLHASTRFLPSKAQPILPFNYCHHHVCYKIGHLHLYCSFCLFLPFCWLFLFFSKHQSQTHETPPPPLMSI